MAAELNVAGLENFALASQLQCIPMMNEEESNLTVILLVIVCPVFSVSAVFNGLLCYIFLGSKGVRHVSDVYIASICAADVLELLIIVPVTAIFELKSHSWHFSYEYCIVWTFLETALIFITVISFTVRVMDTCNYVQQTFPFIVHRILHVHLKFVVSVIWLTGSLIAAVPHMFRTSKDDETTVSWCSASARHGRILDSVIFAVVAFATLLFCVGLYIQAATRMYLRVKTKREHSLHRNSLLPAPNVTPSSWRPKPSSSVLSLPGEGLFTIQNYESGFLSLGLKMFCFYLSWFPYFIERAFCVIIDHQHLSTGFPKFLIIWMPFFSAMINPVVYGFLNKRAHDRLRALCIKPKGWCLDPEETSVNDEGVPVDMETENAETLESTARCGPHAPCARIISVDTSAVQSGVLSVADDQTTAAEGIT